MRARPEPTSGRARRSRRDLLQALARLDPPTALDEEALAKYVRTRQELVDALRTCEANADTGAGALVDDAVAKSQPILAALARERDATARQLAGLHQSKQRLRQLGVATDGARLLSRQA